MLNHLSRQFLSKARANTLATRIAVALPFLCALLATAAMPAQARDCVILLHGLAKSDSSMKMLEQAVAEAGFIAVNVGYPSTDFPIEKLAGPAIAPALDSCARQEPDADTETSRVHFVTHSMGGILVRQYLSRVQVENLGRVVMLGPPNQGSEVVDKLGSFPGFHFIYGDAGVQLGSGKMSVPNTLGAARFDLGIIAGTRSINPILSRMLPGTDDGKVTVERTRLEGMRDHLEMPVTHVFMMKDQKVIAQVIHYLQHGRFKREPEQAADD
ncbi:alpha/beta hydrolase [uncultured Microbulbifer sp.]|uniref:esterase/lipase family protein n=1 Tax=uncultured Microbulbifer sp. TaxID=348147 RepID=UPI002635502B|nr:alpha/beta hydrolase [uncultured Microbulbifer sp.]